MRRFSKLPFLILLAAPTTFAQSPAPAGTVTAPAATPGTEPGGAPPRVEAVPTPLLQPKPAVPVVNKWSATLYGFAELDMIHDTRQGPSDVIGNPVLPHAGTYAGYNDQSIFSIRNSRLGFRFSSPEFRGMKASGLIETDFFGNQPPSPGVSEGGFYNSAGLRVRHAAGKLETPYIDVLAGQYWELFGWQPYFHPNTVEVQGVPGQVYSRTAQLRLSHTFRTDPISFEVAAAASRPPQRDAGLPDGQAGMRLAFNDWRGVRTAGSTGTSIDPMSIGVSGLARRFAIQPPGSTDPRAQAKVNGWGVSVDGLVPVIPGTADDRSNAITLTGSYARGQAIQDVYTGFSNGGSSGTGNAQQNAGSNAYDAGLVAFDASGNLHAIHVTSFMVGAQYYLPVDKGSVWVAGNYSQVLSDNADLNGATPGAVVKTGGAWFRERWADACLFWDVTPAVRFGAEYAWFENALVDGTLAHNQRFQLSAFYLF